jgi:hypothetical protein
MPDREKLSRIGPKEVLLRQDQPMKPPFNKVRVIRFPSPP